MMATGAPVARERERLRGILDGYAAADIGAMLESHSPGAGAARRKAERIDQLVDILADPEFARRAVATLSPLARQLLGIAARVERVSLAALFLAGQEPTPAGGGTPAGADRRDERAVQEELEGLLRRGLLLIDDREVAGKTALGLAEPGARLRWVRAPRAVRDAAPPALDAVPPPDPLAHPPATVEAGSFALLRRDLYLVLRFLRGNGVRLTRTGEPHRTDLRKLLAALQPGQAPARRGGGGEPPDGRLLFLLRLLDATDLARDEGGVLRADSAAEAFLNNPEPVAARALYEAWLDLDWDEFGRLAHLAVEPWSYSGPGDVPPATRIAEARRAIGAVLALLPEGWVGLDAVAATLRRTDPEFLVPRIPDPTAGYANYYNHYGSYYQNWQLQEQVYYRGFARAEARGRDRRLRKDRDWDEVEGAFVTQVVAEPLRWLGLVDAGFAPPAPRGEEGGGAGGRRAGGPVGEGPELRVEHDRPVALRLTSLGRQVLTGHAPVATAAAGGTSLVVQPSFEVLVLDALAHFDLLTQLDAFADAQSLDRAAIYRLTRPALVRGLEAGWTEERIVALLERESGGPLPQNVRHTLQDWAREFERIHLRRDATLLEAPDAALLDRWFADPAIAPLLDRRLSPTAVLVRAGDAAALEAALQRRGTEVWGFNYALDAPQTLDFTGPDRIAIWPEDDEPYLRYRLDRFADREEDTTGAADTDRATPGPVRYRITPESLARAREEGLRIDEILAFLDYKARLNLSPDDTLTLRGWAGYYAPFRYAPVRAVELPPTVSWGDLGRVKALRPLILRVISASLALVAEEHWPKLQAALLARGITLQEQLPAQPAAERQSAAQRAASNLGLATARDLLGSGDARRAGRAGRNAALKRLTGRPLTDFIEEALDAETPLLIEYRNQSDRRSTKRVIEPRELEMRGGAYYLRAFCRLRQEERNFRLANILGVAHADE